MTISELTSGGFTQVGILTTQKPHQARTRRHGVYFEGSAPIEIGVYFLAHKNKIVKFGDTQGKGGLKRRITNYLCNPEKTNVAVREALESDGTYKVYFFQVLEETITLFGVPVKKSISPRSLEQALIQEFERKTGSLPRLNPINR